MNKKNLSTAKVILLGMLIIGVPSIGIHILEGYERGSFRQQVLEDRSDCLKESGDNSELSHICYHIATQAQEAYNNAVETTWITRSVFLGIIYGMFIGILSLAYQVRNLKEKIDV